MDVFLQILSFNAISQLLLFDYGNQVIISHSLTTTHRTGELNRIMEYLVLE